MKFIPAPLAGAFVIEQEPRVDERGFFARAFCAQEFSTAGLETSFVQANNTLTTRKGTVRGFHYQLPPSAEVKLVRCIRGAVYDVIVDIRPDSKTYRQSFGATLDQDNRQMMYVPRGFAHGFVSLTDDAELHYMVSAFYDAKQERGLRYNDPAFSVKWPLDMASISAKDSAWPDFDEAFHGVAAFGAMKT
ncbi:MAG: dTDP-4-dehydrorhamnose 3,5-epimerase [Beijerinckiaceae bacterium]